MKKLFIFVVSALLAVGVLCCVACGDDNDDNKNTPSFRTEVTEEEFKTACTALNSVKNWYYESSSDNPEYIPSLKAYQDSENGVAHFVFLGEGGVTAGESYIVLNGDKVETYSYEVSGVSTVSVPVAEEQQAEWEYDAQTFSSAESAEEYFGSYLITPADVTEVFNEKFADCEYDAEKKCYLYTLTTDDADFAQNAVFEVYFQDANLVSVTENIQIENKVEDTTATGKYVFNQFGAVASADVTVPQSVKDAVADKTVYTVTEEEWQAAFEHFTEVKTLKSTLTTDHPEEVGCGLSIAYHDYENYVIYVTESELDAEGWELEDDGVWDYMLYMVLEGIDCASYYTAPYKHSTAPQEWYYESAYCDSEEDAKAFFNEIYDNVYRYYDMLADKFELFEYDSEKQCYSYLYSDTEDHPWESLIELYFANGELVSIVEEDNTTRTVYEDFGKDFGDKTVFPESIRNQAITYTVDETEWDEALDSLSGINNYISEITAYNPEDAGIISQLVLIDYARHILHNLGHGFFGDPTKDCESYAFVDDNDYYIYTSYYDNGASPEEWTYRVSNCSSEEQAQQYFDYDADGAPEVYAREMPAFSQFRYDSQNKCYKATKTDEHDNQTNIEVYFKNGEIFKIVLDMPDNGVKYVLRNFGMTLVIFPTEIEENATLQTD